MNKNQIKNLKEIIQSSHINFLIGSGASSPFLPLLGDIEVRLDKENNPAERIKIQKEYLQYVIVPNKGIIENGNFTDFPSWNCDTQTNQCEKRPVSQSLLEYQKVKKAYKVFFASIASILLKRKGTILAKQANIFTTNIDILMEVAFEEAKLEYNDGFSGRLNSVFSLSNFRKSLVKRSLHFENVSEIPSFNLMKMHGSLTWKRSGSDIIFSNLSHFSNELLGKDGEDFIKGYQELIIVNPEKKKLEETVMDLNYYELLRMYSSELEKENAALFVLGFSMADKHIQEITIRAADSNPTLKIYVFAYSQGAAEKISALLDIYKRRYSNIEIVTPESDAVEAKYSLERITESVFKNILDRQEYYD